MNVSTNMVDPRQIQYNDLPHIGPGNIESFTGRLLDNVRSVKEEKLISGKFHFNTGDIIYGKINPQLGKYILSDFEGLASADAYVLNTKNELNQNFLFSMLQGNNFYKYSVSVSMRTGMPKINRNELNQYRFPLPSPQEQSNIGNFFKDLDNTLALHQRKYEKLSHLKEGFLQTMFPQKGEKSPKLRFANFEDEWKERKWIDNVSISTNMVDPGKQQYSDLPHIGPGNIESFTGQILNNVKSVKKENLISSKFHFSAGDIIYGKINPQLGKYILSDFEGLASADAYVLNAKNDLNQNFLFSILQGNSFYKYSVSVSMRTGIPKINRNELNQYRFLLPSPQEQSNIGEFLKKLDKTLALYQLRIDRLQILKKAYLQKMFI